MTNYISHTQNDIGEMLSVIGIKDISELFKDIPESVKKEINNFPSKSEIELRKVFSGFESKNLSASDCVCFLGGGAYQHFIPSAVKHIAGRSEFYTAYTPYQPEISQGILKVIFEFQTMISNLFGLDISNASLYDGATALAEAVIMACNYTGRSKVAVDLGINPNYLRVLKTYAWGRGIELTDLEMRDLDEGNVEINRNLNIKIDDKTACCVIAQVDYFGNIIDLNGLADKIHNKKAVFIVITDPISLGLIKPPGEFNADITVGEGQSLGNELNYGGPYLGLMSVRDYLLRFMPGRIAGETVDKKGRKGYVLTFQTREQHIRREKAMSNICSNEALNALKATVFLSLMGANGLRNMALQTMLKANYMKNKLSNEGYEIINNSNIFKEFVVKLDVDAENILKKFLTKKIFGGINLGESYPHLKNHLLIAVTEMRTKDEINDYINILKTFK